MKHEKPEQSNVTRRDALKLLGSSGALALMPAWAQKLGGVTLSNASMNASYRYLIHPSNLSAINSSDLAFYLGTFESFYNIPLDPRSGLGTIIEGTNVIANVQNGRQVYLNEAFTSVPDSSDNEVESELSFSMPLFEDEVLSQVEVMLTNTGHGSGSTNMVTAQPSTSLSNYTVQNASISSWAAVTNGTCTANASFMLQGGITRSGDSDYVQVYYPNVTNGVVRVPFSYLNSTHRYFQLPEVTHGYNGSVIFAIENWYDSGPVTELTSSRPILSNVVETSIFVNCPLILSVQTAPCSVRVGDGEIFCIYDSEIYFDVDGAFRLQIDGFGSDGPLVSELVGDLDRTGGSTVLRFELPEQATGTLTVTLRDVNTDAVLAIYESESFTADCSMPTGLTVDQLDVAVVGAFGDMRDYRVTFSYNDSVGLASNSSLMHAAFINGATIYNGTPLNMANGMIVPTASYSQVFNTTHPFNGSDPCTTVLNGTSGHGQFEFTANMSSFFDRMLNIDGAFEWQVGDANGLRVSNQETGTIAEATAINLGGQDANGSGVANAVAGAAVLTAASLLAAKAIKEA